METSADEVAVTYAKNGFIATTNHYQVPQMKQYGDKPRIMENSLIRMEKIQKWFEARKGTVALENINTILNNHDMDVCSHLEINGAPSGIIWSWIALLGQNVVYITYGPPCKSEYALFEF